MYLRILEEIIGRFYLFNRVQRPRSVFVHYGYIFKLKEWRGRSPGFVGKIEKSTEVVKVKFEYGGVNMKFLFEDLEASIRLESGDRNMNGAAWYQQR